jgi:hypothetical protein
MPSDGPAGVVTAHGRSRHAPRGDRPTVDSDPPVLGQIVDRAMDDLISLRNRELDGDDDEAWVPNAGVPIYTGLFGRDSLTAGWQSALLGPEISRGALRMLAARQATEELNGVEGHPRARRSSRSGWSIGKPSKRHRPSWPRLFPCPSRPTTASSRSRCGRARPTRATSARTGQRGRWATCPLRSTPATHVGSA